MNPDALLPPPSDAAPTALPRQVFLFSGHMVDEPGRAVPRFPADKVDIAAQRIAEALDQMGAGPEDMALTQGASGGDLLFTEACQERGVRVEWLQPFAEAEFIQASVVRGGEAWHRRYLEARARLAVPIRCAPGELGEAPAGSDPYERCNQWLLNTAQAFGPERVRFICLWNGGGGDGPGGTAHMYNEVKRRTGQVIWLDTRLIFG
jgi:hypothetical protein